MRLLPCLLAAFLAIPAVARADSLSISAPAEGVIGGTSTIQVNVTVDAPNRSLTVIRRRVDAGPPCAPSSDEDYGPGQWTEVAAVSSVQSGVYSYEVSWTDSGIKPGDWRFCAWTRESGKPGATARAEAFTNVRSPRATITLDSAKRRRVYIDAGELTTSYRVAVSGTREAPADVTGLWKRRGACPTSRSAVTGSDHPIRFPYRRDAEPGPFDFAGITGGPDVVLGRSYVLCTYVFSRYVDQALAVDRAVVEPKTRPLIEGRPGIGTDGFPARRLTCRKGFWAAHPRRITYRYRWFRDGRPRARTKSIALRRRDRGHRFTCEVAARNAVGTTRKRSPGYRP